MSCSTRCSERVPEAVVVDRDEVDYMLWELGLVGQNVRRLAACEDIAHNPAAVTHMDKLAGFGAELPQLAHRRARPISRPITSMRLADRIVHMSGEAQLCNGHARGSSLPHRRWASRRLLARHVPTQMRIPRRTWAPASLIKARCPLVRSGPRCSAWSTPFGSSACPLQHDLWPRAQVTLRLGTDGRQESRRGLSPASRDPHRGSIGSRQSAPRGRLRLRLLKHDESKPGRSRQVSNR